MLRYTLIQINLFDQIVSVPIPQKLIHILIFILSIIIHVLVHSASALRPITYPNNYIYSNFVLLGSNSAEDFETLYTHDGTDVSPFQTHLFYCQKVGTHNHFRIHLMEKGHGPI